MRVLFFKPDLAWPRSSGHDVHTASMMRALVARGATVALATREDVVPAALDGLGLDRHVVLSPDRASPTPEYSYLQARFASYWGTPPGAPAALGRLAADFGADALVVSGLDVLPMLGAPGAFARIWYAADEWLWHHLSMVRWADPTSWSELRPAVVKGLYERAFGPRLDRVWVVTEPDARAMRAVSGVASVDVIPNGVDTEYFAPDGSGREDGSLVFWGRLDFGPNLQALEWFADAVWPALRARRPDLALRVFGFKPGPRAAAIGRIPGIAIVGDRADIRADIARASVVVLPFVSGGGIKNKLLEAAAMGKAVVASKRAFLGLAGAPPLAQADTPAEWVRVVDALVHDTAERAAMGRRAREWVVAHHTWQAAARLAFDGIASSLSERRR